jgi:hypothetical protein
MLWFGCGLSLKGTCVVGLYSNETVLTDGGIFKRSLIGGKCLGHWSIPSEGINVVLKGSKSSFSFLSM